MDALLRFLVGEIALSGRTGSSTSDLYRYLDSYENQRAHGEVASTGQGPVATPISSASKAKLQAQIWNWLLQHPDVSLGSSPASPGRTRTLEDVEAENRAALAVCRAQHENEAHALSDPSDELLHCACPPHSKILKLFASEEQTWLATTGHGVDHERIPALDFECLSVVAAQREKGLLQPRLARLTGQDLRSVPQRTQRLCDAGHVVRIRTVASGARTSLLILTKFALQRERAQLEMPGTLAVAPRDVPQSRFPQLEAVFSSGKYGPMMDKIRLALDILAEEQIVWWDDLKKKLGVYADHHQSRLLAESIRALEEAQVVERIKARANLPVPTARFHRCVKHLRVITNEELLDIVRQTKRRKPLGGEPESAPVDRTSSDPSKQIQSNLNIDWSPHRQLVQQVRDFVDDEGNDGATLPDIRDSLVGRLFQRPMEQQAIRLVDFWKESQPPHLLHLGILRDTVQIGRSNMFVQYAAHRLPALLRSGQVSSDAGFSLDWASAISHRTEHGFQELHASDFADRSSTKSWSELAHCIEKQKGFQRKRKIGSGQAVGQPPRPRGRPRKYASSAIATASKSAEGAAHADAPGMNDDMHDDLGISQHLSNQSPTRGTNGAGPELSQVLYKPHDSLALSTPHPRGAQSSKPSFLSYEDQAALLSPVGTAISLGSVYELRRHRRGRGPKSRLAIIKTPLLHTLAWFKPLEPSAPRQESIGIPHGEDLIPMPEPAKPTEVEASPRPESLQHALNPSANERVDQSTRDLQRQTPKRPKFRTSEGSIAALRRQLILEAVKQAGGVYPGGGEIWFPFTTAWMKRGSETKPDLKTVKTAVKSLLDQGKLISLMFNFRSKVGVVSTKSILCLPEVDPGGDAVKQLKNNIISADPRYYLPNAPPIDPGLTRHGEASHSSSERTHWRISQETVKFWHLPHYAAKLMSRASKRAERLESRQLDSPTANPRRLDSAQPSTPRAYSNDKTQPARKQSKHQTQPTTHVIRPVSPSLNTIPSDSAAATSYPTSHNWSSMFAQDFAGRPPTRVRGQAEGGPFLDSSGLFDHHARFDDRVAMIEEWEQDAEMAQLPLGAMPHFNHDGEFITLFAEMSDNSDTAAHIDPSLEQVNPFIGNEPSQRRPGSEESGDGDITLEDERPSLDLYPIIRRYPREPRNPERQPRYDMTGCSSVFLQQHSLPDGFAKDLLIAGLLARILLGGLDEEIDWDVVSAMLGRPGSLDDLKNRWNDVQDSLTQIDSDYIDDLQVCVQYAFLRCYEYGLAPTLDYGNISGHDWSGTFDCVIAKLNLTRHERGPDLSEYFECSKASSARQRCRVLHGEPYVYPALDISLEVEDPDMLARIAKSWVRASFITPKSVLDPVATKAKLNSLGNGVIQEAIVQLYEGKTISFQRKSDAEPGRRYQLSEDFHRELKTAMPVAMFHEAVQFKLRMDTRFEGQDRAAVREDSPEGELFAFHNMTAARQLRRYNRSLSETDSDDSGGSDSVWVERTRTYEWGIPLSPLPPPPKFRVEILSEGRELELLPVWYDLSGKLKVQMWEKALACIVSHLYRRPGVTAALLLREELVSSLVLLDVEMIFDWIVEAGVGRWDIGPSVSLNAWWWMCLGEGGGAPED